MEGKVDFQVIKDPESWLDVVVHSWEEEEVKESGVQSNQLHCEFWASMS